MLQKLILKGTGLQRPALLTGEPQRKPWGGLGGWHQLLKGSGKPSTTHRDLR